MITAFTGLTGSGKTLSMVIEACRNYKNTRKPVFSNFKMAVWAYEGRGLGTHIVRNDKKQKMVVPATVLKSNDFIDKLMTTRSGLFLVDEAGFVFNNRRWRTLPFEMMARFQQSRKLGVDIMYTTQAITRVDMTLRELTHVQVICSMENIPFVGEPYLLRNDAFYSELIGHDSKANRELYHAFNERYLWWQFKKYYPLYDTMELIDYSLGSEKKVIGSDIAKPKTDDGPIGNDIVNDTVLTIPPKFKKVKEKGGPTWVEHKGVKVYGLLE